MKWLLLCLLTFPAWADPADLVLRGGRIYQFNFLRPWVQSLAVSQGRIVYVGDDAVEEFIGPSTKVVDLQGKLVLPGFCDAHVHPLWAGLEAARCSLSRSDMIPVFAIHELESLHGLQVGAGFPGHRLE